MAKKGRKLTRDPMNGLRYQWRYWNDELGGWFDYGPAFETEEEAHALIAGIMGVAKFLWWRSMKTSKRSAASMARRKKTRAIVVFGRVWNGNRYGAECTATVYVNGDQVAALEPERGSEDYARQRALEWLFEHDYLPGMKKNQFGGLEPLWQWRARNPGVTAIFESANVERMKDL